MQTEKTTELPTLRLFPLVQHQTCSNISPPRWALCCGDGKDRAERHPAASCQLLFQELALSLLATYAKERCLGLILGYSYNDNSEQQLQMENLPFKQFTGLILILCLKF